MAELADAPDLGSGAPGRMSSSLFARTTSEELKSENAGIAHLVERRLAKAEVAGSSPVSRSTMQILLLRSICIVGVFKGDRMSFRSRGNEQYEACAKPVNTAKEC